MCDDLSTIQPARDQPGEHVTGVVCPQHLGSQSGSRRVVQNHLNHAQTTKRRLRVCFIIVFLCFQDDCVPVCLPRSCSSCPPRAASSLPVCPSVLNSEREEMKLETGLMEKNKDNKSYTEKTIKSERGNLKQNI